MLDENDKVVNVLREFTSSGGIERIGISLNGEQAGLERGRLALVSFEGGTQTVIGRINKSGS